MPAQLRYGVVGAGTVAAGLRPALRVLGVAEDHIVELAPATLAGLEPPAATGPDAKASRVGSVPDVVVFAKRGDAEAHAAALAERHPAVALIVAREVDRPDDGAGWQEVLPPARPLHDDFDPSDPLDLARAIVRARRLAAAEAVTAHTLVEAERQRVEVELAERLKEAHALYSVTQALSRERLSLDERLLEAARCIPPGWQYPEVAECRIVVGEHSYETHDYHESRWSMRAALSADTGGDGYVEVCYVDERPEADEGPFLSEERALLETLARQVSEAVRRDRLETSLQQSQKMQAVGRLAGGVAHDFNNLLTGIGGLTHLLLLDTPEDDPRHADLSEILRATERAAQLTRQLLSFSRKQVVKPVDLDIVALLRRFAPMLERMAGSAVTIELDVSAESLFVHIDETQVEQALLSLVANARDAMPAGGTLELALDAVTLDAAAAAHASPPVRPGDYASLRLTDSGIGMDAETLERAFEPFFTTRPAGAGSGLGLSTVYGIVSQAQGAVEATSSPGAGTTIRLLLPVVSASTGAGASGSRPAEDVGADSGDRLVGDDPDSADPDRGDPVFMVVDDDVAVGQLVARILERAGERAVVYADPVDALGALEQRALSVRALVTDVAMPGMNGLELAQRASRLRPELPVLLMSGYVAESARAEAERLPFIRKPFSPDELLRTLQGVLESPAGLRRSPPST